MQISHLLFHFAAQITESRLLVDLLSRFDAFRLPAQAKALEITLRLRRFLSPHFLFLPSAARLFKTLNAADLAFCPRFPKTYHKYLNSNRLRFIGPIQFGSTARVQKPIVSYHHR
jgi:hypothetical protein